jgi:hypothetical protein
MEWPKTVFFLGSCFRPVWIWVLLKQAVLLMEVKLSWSQSKWLSRVSTSRSLGGGWVCPLQKWFVSASPNFSHSSPWTQIFFTWQWWHRSEGQQGSLGKQIFRTLVYTFECMPHKNWPYFPLYNMSQLKILWIDTTVLL